MTNEELALQCHHFTMEHVIYRIETLSYAFWLAVHVPIQLGKAVITGSIALLTFDSMKYAAPSISLRNGQKDFQFLALMVSAFSESFFRCVSDPVSFHREIFCPFDQWMLGVSSWAFSRPYEGLNLAVHRFF